MVPTLDALVCGPCVKCCQHERVILTKFEDATKYPGGCDVRSSVVMLKRKPNGDCVYLDRGKGCTIYDDRPLICRAFDCRLLAALVPAIPRKQRRANGIHTNGPVLREGRRRLKAYQ